MISYVHIISYVNIRYRTSDIRYRRSPSNHIVYDIVCLNIHTTSYVKYARCRRYISYTISYVRHTTSYVDIRYRMFIYDVVFNVRCCIYTTTSYVNVRCRMSNVRCRTSVLKSPPRDFKFSQYPRPRRGHMGRVFPTSLIPF